MHPPLADSSQWAAPGAVRLCAPCVCLSVVLLCGCQEEECGSKRRCAEGDRLNISPDCQCTLYSERSRAVGAARSPQPQ